MTTTTTCQELRQEIRAFLPDEAQHGLCKDPVMQQAFGDINERLDAIVKSYPAYDALKMRREYYRLLVDKMPVKLFKNSPFYFSVGINGGWANSPGRWFIRQAGPICAENIPSDVREVFHARSAGKFILCCGPYVDSIHHLPPLTKILSCGFKGVWEEAKAELEKTSEPEEREFLEAAIEGLETIHAFQLKFAENARQQLAQAELTPEQRKFMTMIAEASVTCPWEAPRTFYQALNALLFIREILALVDSLYQFALGRLDAMLYPYYQRDLAAGTLTPDEAYDLIARFLIICDSHYDGDRTVTDYGDHEAEIPVTIGGCDEHGEPVFNDLTRFVIRAHRENDLVFPKVHCRVARNSPDEYIRELARDTWNSRCVHTLFNDEVLIPGLMKQGKTLEEARRYVCTGCWGSDPDSVENQDDANYYSLARVLEAMIYQDEHQEQKYGFQFDRLDDCASLEELRDRVTDNLLRFMHSFLDVYTKYGTVFSKICQHPAYSACLEGCLRQRKDETRGGAKYNHRQIVLAFLANVVDSLLAIDYVCFQKKECTVPEFLDAVRRNWQDAEPLRQLAMRAPYWGDDSEASKQLGIHILTQLRERSSHLRNERGGSYIFCLWIYREYRYWGEAMRALPDGRHDGDQLAQALNPSDFRNKGDATTTLSALSCLDFTDFASSNINMTFDKANCTEDTIFAFFKTFIGMKVQLLQPNAFSREELQLAKLHPEKYHGLIVKVCGFSARFVALEPAWQDIIIARRHY